MNDACEWCGALDGPVWLQADGGWACRDCDTDRGGHRPRPRPPVDTVPVKEGLL